MLAKYGEACDEATEAEQEPLEVWHELRFIESVNRGAVV